MRGELSPRADMGRSGLEGCGFSDAGGFSFAAASMHCGLAHEAEDPQAQLQHPRTEACTPAWLYSAVNAFIAITRSCMNLRAMKCFLNLSGVL